MYKQYTVSIVIPCHNEEGGIRSVLNQIPVFVDEVVVIDNNSTDDTSKTATTLGAKVIYEPSIGYGKAYKSGIPAAQSNIIITMDGDASYPINELENMILPIINGDADFVSGNRFPLKQEGAMPWLNRIGNYSLTLITSLLFLTNVKDSQSGMWAFQKKVYPAVKPMSDGMAFSQEIKINAILANLKFKEIPISYYPRIGSPKLSRFRDGILNLFWLLKLRIKIWFNLK